MTFDELGALHSRYLKGLDVPYCVASAEHDARVQMDETIEPLSEEGYHAGVEALAGLCGCGGHYRMDAPVRCPHCHSSHVEEGESTVMYD